MYCVYQSWYSVQKIFPKSLISICVFFTSEVKLHFFIKLKKSLLRKGISPKVKSSSCIVNVSLFYFAFSSPSKKTTFSFAFWSDFMYLNLKCTLVVVCLYLVCGLSICESEREKSRAEPINNQSADSYRAICDGQWADNGRIQWSPKNSSQLCLALQISHSYV